MIAAREQITDDRRLKALLFARNRSQHHWSAGMYFDQASRTWLWYPAGNIRVPEEVRYRDQEGARAYEEFLATRPVLEAFGYVRDELRRRWPDDN